MYMSVILLILLTFKVIICQNPVEVRRARRPNRADHLLCRQKNSGLGIRSSAVLNYSGELCKTYCRVVNRINRSASYVEYVSPNNVRCGPFGARCIEGVCTPATGTSSATITDTDAAPTGERIGRPLDGVGIRRRVRPGRRRIVTPVKTTSLSTIEVTNLATETQTPGVEENAEEVDSIRAKIIFPND